MPAVMLHQQAASIDPVLALYCVCCHACQDLKIDTSMHDPTSTALNDASAFLSLADGWKQVVSPLPQPPAGAGTVPKLGCTDTCCAGGMHACQPAHCAHLILVNAAVVPRGSNMLSTKCAAKLPGQPTDGLPVNTSVVWGCRCMCRSPCLDLFGPALVAWSAQLGLPHFMQHLATPSTWHKPTDLAAGCMQITMMVMCMHACAYDVYVGISHCVQFVESD